jgi:TIR domain-containing protein
MILGKGELKPPPDAMDDLLEPVLAAIASRGSVAPPFIPSVQFIALRTFSDADAPAIRRFQDTINRGLDVDMKVVGGGYGCTRIHFTVEVDSSEEAARLLHELLRSEDARAAALQAGFRVAVMEQPYVRLDLASGQIEGALPEEGLPLFCSYSHEDSEHREAFSQHAKTLIHTGVISEWHDRLITAGTDWEREIDEHLENSQIFVFLVSSSFVASDYCYKREAARAFQRAENGCARIVPVLIRQVDIAGTPLARLQWVPAEGPAVTLWENRDNAWYTVIRGLRAAIRDFRRKSRQDAWGDRQR